MDLEGGKGWDVGWVMGLDWWLDREGWGGLGPFHDLRWRRCTPWRMRVGWVQSDKMQELDIGG